MHALIQDPPQSRPQVPVAQKKDAAVIEVSELERVRTAIGPIDQAIHKGGPQTSYTLAGSKAERPGMPAEGRAP